MFFFLIATLLTAPFLKEFFLKPFSENIFISHMRRCCCCFFALTYAMIFFLHRIGTYISMYFRWEIILQQVLDFRFNMVILIFQNSFSGCKWSYKLWSSNQEAFIIIINNPVQCQFHIPNTTFSFTIICRTNQGLTVYYTYPCFEIQFKKQFPSLVTLVW